MFMQLGFRDGLFDASVTVHKLFDADLVIISPRSKSSISMSGFPRRRLVQAMAHKDVTGTTAVNWNFLLWRNPENLSTRSILALGFEPTKPLLIDTDFFSKYPISNESLKFFINLSKNINGLKIFVGTFEEMIFKHKPNRVFYKEHPTNLKYTGIEDKRESYFSQDNLYPSFFKFWNANQKNIKKLFSES